MSDYLGNLVARTVSPVAVVRPQLPSIFEPSPPGRQTGSELELEQETISEPPPATRPMEKTSPAPQTVEPGPQFHRARTALSARSSFESGERSDNAVGGSVIKSASPTAELRRQEHKEIVAAKKSPTELNSRPATPEPEKGFSRENRWESTSRSGRRDEPQAPQPQLPTLDPSRERGGLVPSAARVQRAPATQPVIPAIRALPQVEATPAPTPEPTINVTIGRVEIRAAVPPARPPARPKPASVLSLEDYLRQRANGGRR